MTKYLLASFLMMGITAAYAQDPGGILPGSRSISPEAAAILTKQIAAHKSAKTSAANPRLAAYTESYEGYGTDSLIYIYGGSRRSGKIIAGEVPGIAFSVRGDVFVNADSIDRYSSPQSMPTAPLIFRYRDHCTWGAGDRILTHTTQGSTATTIFRTFYTYDTRGNVTRRQMRSAPIGTSTFTDMQDSHFRYNAKNLEVFDSMYVAGLGPTWRRYSYYDASDRLSATARYDFQTATGTWRQTDTMVYTYYPNSLLKTLTRNYLTGTTYGEKDSFGYTGSNPLHIYRINWKSSSGGPWVPDYQYVNTLTPDGSNYQLMLMSGFNGTTTFPYDKMVGYFNADSTAKRAEFYRYVNGVPKAVPHMTLNYYYEKKGTTPPASVAGVRAGNGLHIYPNPAGALITIDLPKSPGSYRVEVIDAAGRMAGSSVCEGGAARLDVAALPAGWYGVRVKSVDGAMDATGRFVKE